VLQPIVHDLDSASLKGSLPAASSIIDPGWKGLDILMDSRAAVTKSTLCAVTTQCRQQDAAAIYGSLPEVIDNFAKQKPDIVPFAIKRAVGPKCRQ